MPGQTTLDEAKRIFVHLGLPLDNSIAQGNQVFYAPRQYQLPSGLSITVVAAVQDKSVSTMRTIIQPAISPSTSTPSQWSAYMPDSLIRQYGRPSRVDIAGGGTPHEPGAQLGLFYVLDMYFDVADLIIEYKSVDGFVKTNPATSLVHICPVSDQFEIVRAWFGKNPDRPPISTYPIDQAASLSLQQFATLMTGQAGQACFDVGAKFFNG